MRLIFIGDVVGRSGRKVLYERLPQLREELAADFVVVNGENAAGGFGITEEIFRDIRDAGADVVTLGNHAFDQREALVFIEREPTLLRPINYPAATPGRGVGLYPTTTGRSVLVMNVMGRLFMDPLDDPFAAIDRELENCPLKQVCDAAVIDIHAEATSEKMGVGHFADGRASLVVGTHTHVPTADHQILPRGTAYITDAGMTGDYNSIIGMDIEEPLTRFTRKLATGRFEPAGGEATLCGVGVDVDDETGLARAIAPIRVGGRLEQILPAFWLS
ncbi:TIGR00282 family metallophosphoesterase [Rhodoligotrophos defluvii]|uniref:TIGR00282 family metallophosphoesterase n=1 Tax=Rhodoligotrophos defluvii TaxID=2561934 RepID=UPI0010C9511D|nr:TIGR00282 family metallophosphoesterase [Rhodoligotrophos defluvii]